jgi:hypothetical protein
MFTNNEVFIYDTAVVILVIFPSFDANFINVFFELIVNYECAWEKFFFAQNQFFKFYDSE